MTDPAPITSTEQSIWSRTAQMPMCTPLTADTGADVCIIGAGIAGLTAAYLLARAGRSVVVLEDGPLAGGMTRVTTAHLSNAIDDRYLEVERIHGQENARLAAESHTAAIDLIESIVAAEKIDCDFERLDGYLFLPPGGDARLLEDELAAAHRAGLRTVEKVGRAPFAEYDTGPCLRFPRQGQFHPLKYLAGLARAITRDGGRLHTQTHADKVISGSPGQVMAGNRVVTAGSVIVATNSPINDRVAMHTKQAPYMTYVIAARVPADSVPRALYWDTLDPYHYVRLQRGGELGGHDLLIVGGEDHKTGHAEDTQARHGRLESWARERFPMIKKVDHAWIGQVMETLDGLAFIGRNPMDTPNIYIATGDSGMGMTHGTIAGILLTDLILGRNNPWSGLYDPGRKPLGTLADFASGQIDVATQYAQWLTGGEVTSVDEIPRDSGAVMRRGLGKVAVYRDAAGQVHERSAVCRHLGCIVQWNPLDKSWDCACHGSRYDKFGQVVNGPANEGLASGE